VPQLEQTSYPSRPSVATIINVDHGNDDDWREVARQAIPHVVDEADGPLHQILDVVRSRECLTVVVEDRYVDLDYRSEYSSFWSCRFDDHRPETKRLHFFRAALTLDDLLLLPEDHGYLGYCVIRPTYLGALGRTVIAPPHEHDALGARLTRIVDRPSLFGNPLEISGVPFCQQDGELLRCAHAAAWVCHYVAFHHRIVGRRVTADIAAMPSVEGSKYRSLPSTGLTGEQLQGVFSAIGIPALFYEIDHLPKLPADIVPEQGMSPEDHNRRVRDERVFRVVCRYLNSGFPVVALTEGDKGNHAFTLVGWMTGKDGRLRLIACDDQIGPYEEIGSPELDAERRGTWRGFMIPLPSDVYLTGEAAENRARQIVAAEYDHADSDDAAGPSDLAKIAPKLLVLGSGVSVRSRLIEGRRYKAMVSRQERHPEAVRVARMAYLPRWVWVIEFQDSDLRDANKPCVLAEIVFDSSSHDERPDVSLLSTASLIIDTKMSGLHDGEHEEPVDMPVWFGLADGRLWRSLISDPGVSDREYGEDKADPSPPGSPARQTQKGTSAPGI
jgi:hypothetical protein